MSRFPLYLSFLLVLVSVPATGQLAAPAAPPPITLASPINPGTAITVTGKANESVVVLVIADNKVNAGICGNGNRANWTPLYLTQKFTLVDTMPHALALSKALVAGNVVCVVDSADEFEASAKVEVAASGPNIEIESDLIPSLTSVPLLLDAPGDVSVSMYQLDKSTVKVPGTLCDANDLSAATALTIGAASSPKTVHLTGSTALQLLKLQDGLDDGALVCLSGGSSTATPHVFYSKIVKVAAAKPKTRPSFTSKVVGGQTTIEVRGQKESSLRVIQFESSYAPKDITDCGGSVVESMGALDIAQSGSSASTSVSSIPLGDPPQKITLSLPLVANAQLCLEETPKASTTPSTPGYSAFTTVADPDDYGRVRSSITAGTVITNQQTSGSTSTAAEYVDFGFDFTFARAGGGTPAKIGKGGKQVEEKPIHWYRPGFYDFIHLSLTSVPVATSTKTVTGTTANLTDLSVLTTQQSARIWGGIAFPFRVTDFYKGSNSFVIAPVFRGGFDTLLNPSLSSSQIAASTAATSSRALPADTTTTTNPLVTSNFSQVYSSLGYGIRASWEQFSKDPDRAPKQIAVFDILRVNSSNLPSFLCDPKKPYGSELTAAPTNTTCFVTSTATDGTKTYRLDASRTLVPRLVFSGYMKFPNYPFVLGTDANLAQYSFGNHHDKIDVQNKPGNDVRIYFGVNLDISTAIKKLNLGKQ